MEDFSPHITYQEGIASQTAQHLGIDNTPNANVMLAMKYWATHIFEKVRAGLGNKPIKVSSFYRSPKLNTAIGGATNSQHCLGQAGDMDGDTYGTPSNKQIFELIRDRRDLIPEFDQLIIEGITDGKIAWIHCSITENHHNRMQILFMYKKDGKTIYEPYSDHRYNQLVP